MTPKLNENAAWEETSWKGHRRAQHQAFHQLSFADKLKTLEDMGDFARQLTKDRQRTGEPYIDPGTASGQVAETPAHYPAKKGAETSDP
jgi:hypothetical protein